MQDLVIVAEMNAGKAQEAIFDACRANRNRFTKGNVSFSPLANGNFQALLRNEEGYLLAVAEVDEFDN